jgi:molybdopterin/thiamine biosynthesis adenylyltransferase
VSAPTSKSNRYIRQSGFAPLGEEGQRKICNSTIVVCGCGALGSVLANTLARAGVGKLRIIDRDYLEWNNLQRQVLYTEKDVTAGIPKAVAAKAHLEEINSDIEIEAVVCHISADNVIELVQDADCIVDGTDNFETRFLINDAAIKLNIPWIYGGCIGSEGQTMTIIPEQTPCLHCLMQAGPPPPGTTPTCDSAGILGSVINVIASIQALEALKIVSGNANQISPYLHVFDLWENRTRQVKLGSLLDLKTCPTCYQHDFKWLAEQQGSSTAVLCGRNAVQVNFHNEQTVSLKELADKLKAFGTVTHNTYLLRAQIDDYQLTVFPDGRAIIQGTNDPNTAHSVYAKYIGN